MKILMLFLCLVLPAAVQAQNAPMSLAGIVLGANISSIHYCCLLSTDIPLSEERHLKEIDLMPQFVPGVKSGSVAYANCGQKGTIVRIKLKFDNPSRSFFDDLMERYTNTWGKPLKWRGNPFQTVVSWKWSFKNAKGQNINLELTHSKDEDYKTGNFVKLTLRSLWEEEAECYQQTLGPSEVTRLSPTPEDKLDYMLLIPR